MERLEDRRLLSAPPSSGTAWFGEAVETSAFQSSHAAGATTDRLFALHVEGGLGLIYEVNPTTGAAINSFPAPETIGASGYQGLALGSESLFFVDGSGNGPHTLYELDCATGMVIDSDPVGTASDPPVSGLAYLDGLVYLGRASNRSLLAWNTASDQLAGTLSVNFAISGGLTGAGDLGLLFDSNSSGEVAAIDPNDGRVVRQFDVGSYSLSGGLAYVGGELLGGDYSKRKIYRINPETGTVFGSFLSPGSGTLTGLAGDGAAPAPGEIRGDLWYDANGDGCRDFGEPPLAGWTVFIDDDQDGNRDAGEPWAVTDGAGQYAIGNIAPGTHLLTEEVAPGWQQTFPGPSPSHGRLFALWTHDETDAATVVEVAPADGTAVNTFAVPGTAPRPGFQGLAVGPDRLYYVEGESFALYELTLDSGAVIDSHLLAPSNGVPISGLAYLDGLLYLVQHDYDRILTWDPQAEAIVQEQAFSSVDLGGSLTGAGDQGLLFCGNGAGEVLAIAPATGMIERSFSSGLGALQGGMAYVDGQLIVGPFEASTTAYRIDPVSGAVLGTLELGSSPPGLLTGLGGDGATETNTAGSHFVDVLPGSVVEDVDFGNVALLDFGDAPALGYPTVVASDGARHVAAGPLLGKLRDAEIDGLPNATATGDDTTDTDDEDGLAACSPLVPGDSVTLDVEVSAASHLNLWIDFNRDGDWNDADEHIQDSDIPVTAGLNRIEFTVPQSAAAGPTYARFRLTEASTGGTLSPTGLAADGEVEDHQLTIETAAGPCADLVGRLASTGEWYVARSSGDQFTTEKWGRWSTSLDWQDIRFGDFDGDGSVDIAGRLASSGDWYVASSTGTSFVTAKWGRWSPGLAWQDIRVGDFNGDARDDLVGRLGTSGDWYVAESTGTGFRTMPWGRWSKSLPWQNIQVGDFNGDGSDDLVGCLGSSGDWYVGLSTGTNFATANWGRWSTSLPWQDIHLGDFNGDGSDDLVGRLGSTGDWYVGLSTGANFSTAKWGRWSANLAWQDIRVGDFDGDGSDDLVGRLDTSGDWYVAQSTGAGFSSTGWGRWSPRLTWQDIMVGDFNGDGSDDLVGRVGSSGDWYVGRSTKTAFATEKWGRWSTGLSWQHVGVGQFAAASGGIASAGANGSPGTGLALAASLDRFWQEFAEKAEENDLLTPETVDLLLMDEGGS